jgi:gliding motility-associated lipoprotein GldH
MIRMKNVILGIATSLVFFGCQPEGRVFVEYQELSPEVEWLKKDTRTFNVPVEDISIAYDLSLSYRYASGYQYPETIVAVTETSPSGVEVTKDYTLKVVDAKGDYIGEPGLDIWDSEHLIVSGKEFEEKGTYTYTISHKMDDPLAFAMEIGVVLDKK